MCHVSVVPIFPYTIGYEFREGEIVNIYKRTFSVVKNSFGRKFFLFIRAVLDYYTIHVEKCQITLETPTNCFAADRVLAAAAPEIFHL